jgi:hypothetical protein
MSLRLGFAAQYQIGMVRVRFADCMVGSLAGYTQTLMRIRLFVGEARKD